MKSYKVWAGLFVLVLFLGAVTLTKADSPTNEKGNFDPGPIQTDERVLDRNNASITQLTLITSTLPLSFTKYISKTVSPGDLYRPIRLGSASGDINAAAYFIGIEDFEGDFPQPNWNRSDDNGTGHLWGDVFCYPLEDTFEGYWSGWPASEGINGVDPCADEPYPNDLNTWLIYGPFNLQDAAYADVQFFYRIISEMDVDKLFWGASTNGTNFFGNSVSGTHISGPYNNGYNEIIFNFIPELGQSQVWFGLNFTSDGSVTNQGPFIDGINIYVEETGITKTFLPIIIKDPPPTTQLYVKNNTSGSVTFTVQNTPQGNISCNVPAGQTNFCGQFTPGTYNATSNAAACPPPTTKSKTFNAGTVTLTVVCR
jgi:hypothetical protein